jgi:septal ring factor EnvC (AmiA/AmiB activator)
MIAAQEYMNILQTDVNKTLDQSRDRQAMLESIIDGLKFRGKKTNEYLANLASQRTDLQAALTASTARIATLKSELSASYAKMDYDGTQRALDEYIVQKDKETYARSYIVFLDKFAATYTSLNSYNRKLLDTLVANREALIKNVTVVLPDSGNEFVKKLELLRTESEVRSAPVE